MTTAAAIEPGRLRRAAVWATQMWAYKIAFEAPHDDRERLQQRMHIDYPIAIDSAIGLGDPPGQRLQKSLRHPPRITRLDWVMVGIYALWELEPHAALAFILWRHPRRFVAAATRLAATFDLTVVGYWAIPTSPPWWASEKAGRMDGVIRRVVLEAKRELRDEPRPGVDHEVGANPWAAMPSDHFATALATALVLFELDRRVGAAALAYAGALGFALVYLGEHYVADLLAGLGLALGVRQVAPPLTPMARIIAARWPHP
jgi:membrane-associated phospholipid phosphatase